MKLQARGEIFPLIASGPGSRFAAHADAVATRCFSALHPPLLKPTTERRRSVELLRPIAFFDWRGIFSLLGRSRHSRKFQEKWNASDQVVFVVGKIVFKMREFYHIRGSIMHALET